MTFWEGGLLIQKCPRSRKKKENRLPQALINFEEELLHKSEYTAKAQNKQNL